MQALPEIVSESEWQAAVERLRVKEKAHMKEEDALAAERRRLPMVEIEQRHVLHGPDGPVRLVDVFEGRPQLLLYHFMLEPGETEPCEGCSMVVDNVGHPAHLAARGVTYALVSRAPLPELEAYRRRMGWTLPWYSSHGTDFNEAVGVGTSFALSVFVRDGDRVFRTYVTRARGLEALGTTWSYLDLTPFGRQERWEDTPPGRPQSEPYAWWRRHDEYGAS